MRINRLVIACAMTVSFLLMASLSPARATREIEFARDIQPILAKACLSCHGPEKQEAGLRLDRGDLAMFGGDSGKAILPGKSEQSRLIHYVSGRDADKVMPPEGPRLSAEEIETLRKWIDQGATWPEGDSKSASKNDHWAYQPLHQNNPPQVIARNWPINPIDQFVLAKLESRGLSPSPEADRYTLIRRLSLDLIGLLPTISEVDAFCSDTNADAYEHAVDRMLQSPHFGERWGRHWLDMARYADSDGYEKDNPRPDAFLWRDWVIDAINADMPFDQFTIEQIAGDLLPDATQNQRLATAFHRQTLTNTEGGADQEQFRVEACFDRTETTGAVWLGLTIGCARCHSHKYDAISQREYYQLFAFYNNGDEQTFSVPKTDEEIRKYGKELAAHEVAIANAQSALRDAPKEMVTVLTDKLNAIKKKAPAKPEHHVRVVAQRSKNPRKTFVLRRGEFLDPIADSEVYPNGLGTLMPLRPRNTNERGDRLDLARWLVSKDNPLTPRVTVNHVWRTLFGAGIVKTANDFGVRGEPPTHPELLDWLASNFIGLNKRDSLGGSNPKTDWSRKALIKQIVMSATYRQSSKRRLELSEIDPQNKLLACQNRIRVEGEIVRDISLDAAGLLTRKIGGPSVFPALPPGIAELSYAGNFKWTVSNEVDRYRRGLYTFFKRTAPHPNLITFDCPDANITCVDRSKSNTPLQALVALNNESFLEASQAFAKRILESGPTSDANSKLVFAFRICLARPPREREAIVLAEMLESSRRWYSDHMDEAKALVGKQMASNIDVGENAAWIATLRVLMNLDEFITRE